MQRLLPRKVNWKKEIRESPVVNQFRDRLPDRDSIEQLRSITDGFIDASSRTPFSRQAYYRETSQCDDLFAEQLRDLSTDDPFLEAGIVACAHVVTAKWGRDRLHRLQRIHLDNHETIFNERVPAYLRCLTLVHSVRRDIVTDLEAQAAKEMLAAISAKKARSRFPSIWGTLEHVGRDEDDRLLSDLLVETILRSTNIRNALSGELETLRATQRWVQAYRICQELQSVTAYTRVAHIIRDLLPNYPMWASWQPSPSRITLWETPTLFPYRARLASVLELEGPDVTGRQQRVLRLSSTGTFDISHTSMGMHILEELLDTLDVAAAIGSGAVDFFLASCVEPTPLNERFLRRLKQGLSLKDDDAGRALAHLTRALAPNTPMHDRMTAFTDALPVLGRSMDLQMAFGSAAHLAMLAHETLTKVQTQFGRAVERGDDSEAFGLRVQALASAMLASEWLHGHWTLCTWTCSATSRPRPPCERLSRPCESRARTVVSPWSGVCWSLSPLSTLDRPPHAVASAPAEQANVVMFDDPVWFEDMTNELDRLRATIKRIKDIDSDLATQCVRQSKLEKPSFVSDLVTRLQDNDQASVSLAACIRMRANTWMERRADDACWTELLTHTMRMRPPGLLDRLAKVLPPPSWERWVENLNALYGGDLPDLGGPWLYEAIDL
ncbi:unnamed protein product [Parascedosporium putredinis]|uniref:Uncharacterized protein n=1 Tax=Parascedosporium putredinis TaxID=1442378 RepID=A0A9P1M844_9PEZI|nr:unnamed protein product [Parascedosporium putredinis]CAI7991858.1 unnamed protein product [Parascedosporium putredinis]